MKTAAKTEDMVSASGTIRDEPPLNVQPKLDNESTQSQATLDETAHPEPTAKLELETSEAKDAAVPKAPEVAVAPPGNISLLQQSNSETSVEGKKPSDQGTTEREDQHGAKLLESRSEKPIVVGNNTKAQDVNKSVHTHESASGSKSNESSDEPSDKQPGRPEPLDLTNATAIPGSVQSNADVALGIASHCLNPGLPNGVIPDIVERARLIENEQRNLIAQRSGIPAHSISQSSPGSSFNFAATGPSGESASSKPELGRFVRPTLARLTQTTTPAVATTFTAPLVEPNSARSTESTLSSRRASGRALTLDMEALRQGHRSGVRNGDELASAPVFGSRKRSRQLDSEEHPLPRIAESEGHSSHPLDPARGGGVQFGVQGATGAISAAELPPIGFVPRAFGITHPVDARSREIYEAKKARYLALCAEMWDLLHS